MRAYAHKLAFAKKRSRGTLGIRRVSFKYADIRRCSLFKRRGQISFGHVQICSAYASLYAST